MLKFIYNKVEKVNDMLYNSIVPITKNFLLKGRDIFYNQKWR